MTTKPEAGTACFAMECPRPAVHLVDFTSAGEGWLPMCDECKKMDDALMAMMKRDPVKAKLAEELIADAENLRRQ